MHRLTISILACVCGVAVYLGCAPEEDDDLEAGAACAVPEECYPDVDPTTLRGEVICLDRVEGGYCTHLCQTDADCCAVEGECDNGLPQVCAPFESTGMYMCFLSCEDAEVGEDDPEWYCDEYAHPDFGCRSTGGGSDNRKVCA